jgi:kynurenine formamidase
MKITDLSHCVRPDMPVYPGDRPPEFNDLTTLAADGFREMEVTFNTHLGTHVDVPAHVLPQGNPLEQMSVERFLGPACCIDLTTFAKPLIDATDLNPFRNLIAANEFVLFKTAWSRRWGSEDYFKGFPTLSPEAASWLADFPLKGIGIDTISLDRLSDTDLPVHRALLKQNICLIENLTRLDDLPQEGFLFSCLPVKVTGGDGFPVRAVAVFL